MLDDRAKLLLKALVERYIADGQPVGSRTLSRASGLDLSPATIRNVMADLEELGLIASPHTSAGRIPTARGYRLFVDTMLTVQRESVMPAQLAPEQPQKVIANAAQLLSNLSQFVGVVMAPRRTSVFRHIEFLRLSEKRFLVIIVSPEGDVQNRVIFTEVDHSQSQLVEASNFLNAHYAGLAMEQVRERLKSEVDVLRGEIASLMQAAVNVGSEALSEAQDEVVISGERNLLSVSDFSSDMGNLRRAFDLFEQKTQILRLLDISSQAEGVRIYIGGESQVVPFEELSIVSSPYEVDGKVVGISPDTLQDEVKPEIYYYRVFIRTEQDSLQNKAGKDISVLVEKLYNQMMNYRNQMTSIDASLNFAEEYLRMKNAAFLEGMSSSTDLIDAELNLAGVRTERLQAAYNFDLLLAQLLEAAGISDEFSAYARRADARPILFDKK